MMDCAVSSVLLQHKLPWSLESRLTILNDLNYEPAHSVGSEAWSRAVNGNTSSAHA